MGEQITYKRNEVKFSKCSESVNFSDIPHVSWHTAQLQYFQCIDASDLYFEGSFLSYQNSHLIFEIERCQQEVCATEAELKRFLNTHAFIGVTTTSFIENDNFSTDPIRSQLDYTFIEMLSPDFEPIYRSVKLHVNLAELNDDALALYDGESRAISTFFSTEAT